MHFRLMYVVEKILVVPELMNAAGCTKFYNKINCNIYKGTIKEFKRERRNKPH